MLISEFISYLLRDDHDIKIVATEKSSEWKIIAWQGKRPANAYLQIAATQTEWNTQVGFAANDRRSWAEESAWITNVWEELVQDEEKILGTHRLIVTIGPHGVSSRVEPEGRRPVRCQHGEPTQLDPNEHCGWTTDPGRTHEPGSAV